MEEQKRYTVNFIYDVQDHALKFPLQAEVKSNDGGIYTVENIRLQSDERGCLLPPLQLQKVDWKWIFVDNGKESELSSAIGKAIEAHEAQ
jgi:hypothetical protein